MSGYLPACKRCGYQYILCLSHISGRTATAQTQHTLGPNIVVTTIKGDLSSHCKSIFEKSYFIKKALNPLINGCFFLEHWHQRWHEVFILCPFQMLLQQHLFVLSIGDEFCSLLFVTGRQKMSFHKIF